MTKHPYRNHAKREPNEEEIDVMSKICIEDEDWKLVHEVNRTISNEGVNATRVYYQEADMFKFGRFGKSLRNLWIFLTCELFGKTRWCK